MKKILIFLALILLTTYSVTYASQPELIGEAAILMDMDTGQILYEKNAHQEMYPASTTKIMTAILALEYGDFDDIVTVDEEIVYLTDGGHIALEPGEELLFEDMLNAILIESANDAAMAMAKHISGSLDEFANLMNAKAEEIGALNTNFTNPSGLPDEAHITTAHDLALIAQYAMGIEEFRNIVENYTYQIPLTNKKDEIRYLKSNNRLLYSSSKINVDGQNVPIIYEGVNGIKSGYTNAAKSCLVTSARRDGRNLLAVVLKSDGYELYADTHKLLNHGFDDFHKVIIDNKNQFVENVPVEEGVHSLVAGITEDDFVLTLPKDPNQNISKKVIFNKEIHAPIKKGDVLGKVQYFLDTTLLGEINIISTLAIEEVPEVSPSLMEKIIGKWYFLMIALILFLWIRSNIRRKRQRKRRSYMYIKNG